MVRPVPRVRRPSSEPMNANAPHTAIHALYKRAFAYSVCPTPKLLRALIATLYPPGYRASAMTIMRMNCAAPTKKSAPRSVRFSMLIITHPTVSLVIVVGSSPHHYMPCATWQPSYHKTHQLRQLRFGRLTVTLRLSWLLRTRAPTKRSGRRPCAPCRLDLFPDRDA